MPIHDYTGNDNYGQPKQAYLDKIAALDDTTLLDKCEQAIWLSAYAANNPRSDFHWQVDACYDECIKRGKGNIYERAYKQAEASTR